MKQLLTIGIMLVGIFILFETPVSAQYGESEICITKVGEPDPAVKPSPGPLGCNKGASTDLVRAAEAIKTAYDLYGTPPGATFEYSGLASKLADSLLMSGYAIENVDAFEIRRGNSLVDSSAVPGDNCTECLGFIGIVAALWSGTADCSKTLCDAGHDSAGSVHDLYKSSGFDLGNSRFLPIGSGISAQIQPGDIAMAGTSQDAGHIGIVYKLIPGSDTQMILIESNGYVDCRVTTDRVTPKDQYTFFRKT